MDIVDQIVGLRASDILVLPLAVVAEAFGVGEAGITSLQEIAEDNNCSIRVDFVLVAVVGL